LHVLARKALPIGGFLERTVKAGRGNLQTIIVNILDGKDACQLMADRRTVVDIDVALLR